MSLISRRAAKILMHRLEVPDCIADALEQDEGSDAFQTALTEAIAAVTARNLAGVSTLALAILKDAADGSTYFAGLYDAVALGEVSRYEARESELAADHIERILRVSVPRK